MAESTSGILFFFSILSKRPSRKRWLNRRRLDKSQHNVAYQYGIPNGKLPELGQPIRLCRTSEGYLAVLTSLVESPKPNSFVQPIFTAYHFRNKDNLSNPTLDFEYFFI